MRKGNVLLLGGELVDDISTDDTAASESGAVDSLGIKYNGDILEGMVSRTDALQRCTTRANPLDPFNVEWETWDMEEDE